MTCKIQYFHKICLKKCENWILGGDFFCSLFRCHFGTDFAPFFGPQNFHFFLFFSKKRLLGRSLAILGGILDDKASKMLPRRPKEPTQGSKRLPEGLQKTSRRPPRCFFKAPNGFQERVLTITL